MKTQLVTLCFVVSAAIAPLAAYAEDSDSDRSHPVTFVKDSGITTEIKTMLANEKMASLAHIHVDTDNAGVVVLSGNVKSQAEADKAISIARGIKGVTSVKSELVIKKDM